MATRRWRDGDDDLPTPTPVKEKNKGINPDVFHRKLRKRGPLTTSEKELEDILRLVKRREYTSGQRLQREAYTDVTSLKVFPLQNLAMEYLDEMMNEYLGKASSTTKSDAYACGSIPTKPPLKACTRKKIRRRDEMAGSKEQYTMEFLAEKNCVTSEGNEHDLQHRFLPALWSMEPRIFALETTSGKRRYIVGNLGRILQHYWRDCIPQNRHYYELIREGTPCRCYFDLEFDCGANPHIKAKDAEVLMTEFISELCNEFQTTHGIRVTRSCIIDLDSSTEKKFSRHLIVHLPNRGLFADAWSAGAFAKNLVGRLMAEISTGELPERRPMLANHLFVRRSSKSDTTCFVDLGVYTRNRLFRLLGSVKYGKNTSAALRIAESNTFPFPNGFDNSKLYARDQIPCWTSSYMEKHSKQSQDQDHEAFRAALDWETHADALSLTLVVPTNGSKIAAPIMMDPNGCCKDHKKPSVPFPVVGRAQCSSSLSCHGDSPIRILDEFVLKLSQRGGIQGRIRSWSIETVGREGNQPVSYFMRYQMSENRWCENIGRAHKSNNIIWNIDLRRHTYWQTCHDPDCRAGNFRGTCGQMPDGVAEDIDSYILDQELAELDEGELFKERNAPQILESNAHLDLDYGTAQFDEALANLDMTRFLSASSS
ncbi:hypothetical protein ACHAWF_013751 [Thalassiosira exigua]